MGLVVRTTDHSGKRSDNLWRAIHNPVLPVGAAPEVGVQTDSVNATCLDGSVVRRDGNAARQTGLELECADLPTTQELAGHGE